MNLHLDETADDAAIPLTPLDRAGFASWREQASPRQRLWTEQVGFSGEAGTRCLLPGEDGRLEQVVCGVGNLGSPWSYGDLPARLPAGAYRLSSPLPTPSALALGWALGSYDFHRYRKERPFATLAWPAGCDRAAVTREAEAVYLGRNLINTPAGDMGPAELAAAAEALAEQHGARCQLIVGDELLAQNYPAVHAVGRASSRPPRLIDIRWGDAAAPKLTLVGKGVCFDSGGLDLKNAAGMKLMKKDMGGGATILGLAHAIMAQRLPVCLRVLVPAVENSVSGDAFRPLDVLSTRKGLTVEVGNTDAEGRLILCDALAEASSESPDLLIDFATLTGAARVALGTELPALFCNDDDVAAATLEAAAEVYDPLWRMPLHDPYRKSLDSPVADLNNIGSSSFGGAITAALFLREFVAPKLRWIHVDTMAWNLEAKPGRPVGGEAMGLRAMLRMLERRYRKASR